MQTAIQIRAVIPARNEARFIGAVVHQTRQHVSHVLVVNDGSLDATAAQSTGAGAEVISHPTSFGKGESIKTGIRHALKDPAWTHLLLLDGDGQHDPQEIPQFLSAAQAGALFVIGNRMHNPTGMPWLRRFVNRWVSWEICTLCEQPIPDTQCGYRLVHRSLVPKLLCESTGFDYETEVLILLAWAGITITSVPVSSRYGVEKSKINPIPDTLRYWALMHRYRRLTRSGKHQLTEALSRSERAA